MIWRYRRGNIWRDDGGRAAIFHAQREHIHSLAAHPDAPVAENAPWTIEEHHRRPLLLLPMILRLRVKTVRSAVLDGHVLQFALAARIAHRTIQRMISQQ